MTSTVIARRQRNAQGFSLVEAAVVLVVIGIILGAVLQGRSLIESAEYKSFRQELRDYRSAFHNFRDRYDALPGDFVDAATRIESGLGNGDGNGLIGDDIDCDSASDENCLAWQHLRAAGTLGGNPSTEGTAAPPEHAWGGRFDAFFTGTGVNGDFGHKLLITDVPVEIAERLDADEDDDRCEHGRITGQVCEDETAWPDDVTVDVVYAL